MQINIYKDKMLGARLFGTSVLYSTQPIPQEDVPQGWYCYDLRGTARHPDEPHALVDKTKENHTGSVLSRLPLKNGRSQYRLVKNMFQMTGTNPSLAEFCAAENVCCPEVPLRHQMRPASPEEAGFFYAQTPEKDEEMGAIGHVRIDFGHEGKEFWHSWWPRGPEELNTQEFKGDYQAYLSCFDKQTQHMGLTALGRQRLRDVTDPTLPHSYEWYVIEHINTPERRLDHQLPLEEAMQLYASLDCEDKRLGVTKDDITAVDLVIHWEGREWLSADRLKMDDFKDDPVVAGAADKLQQMLDEAPAVGRVTFASGEQWSFTDLQKYLQVVCEELPCQATTGFRCETLTDDPVVRKAVDDMIYDLYGGKIPVLWRTTAIPA